MREGESPRARSLKGRGFWDCCAQSNDLVKVGACSRYSSLAFPRLSGRDQGLLRESSSYGKCAAIFCACSFRACFSRGAAFQPIIFACREYGLPSASNRSSASKTLLALPNPIALATSPGGRSKCFCAIDHTAACVMPLERQTDVSKRPLMSRGNKASGRIRLVPLFRCPSWRMKVAISSSSPTWGLGSIELEKLFER